MDCNLSILNIRHILLIPLLYACGETDSVDNEQPMWPAAYFSEM